MGTLGKDTRVLLTGAGGMIGANLARRLVVEGARVCALVRPMTDRVRLRAIEHQLEFLPADVTDAAAVREAVRQAQPQVVFHLASTLWARSSQETAANHFQTNVMGTLHLLEALREFPEARVVFTGSSAAYGGGSRLREDQPLRPATVYGASKASASLLLQAYARAHRMHTVELRVFMPYGPWEDPGRLIPHTVLSALARRDVAMTRGDQQRDLVYIEDVVEALVLATVRPVPSGSVFNIGSGIGTPVRHVVERILRLMGDPVKPRVGVVPTRPDEIMELSADITAARAQLGWAPRTSLDEGLRASIAWCTNHRELMGELTRRGPALAEAVSVR